MAFKDQLVDRIKKKEAEIQVHEAKIREAKVYIQALQDVIRTLPGEGSASEPATPDSILRPGSMTYKTYELLKGAGKPLHISDILSGIGEEQGKKASLVSSLATYVKNQQIFTRPLPNTFGLIDMEDDYPVPDEPPEDFGLFQDNEEDQY